MISRRTVGKAALASLVGGIAGGRAFATGPVAIFEISKTPEEWKKILTPEAFHVLREHGTERPGTSPLDKTYAAGIYNCAGCDLPIYSSEAKYDSGTGWPSFWQALDNAVGTSVDKSLYMTRTEVHCRRCGGHLGHIFDNGPQPTGERHCLNGVSLKFVPKTSS